MQICPNCKNQNRPGVVFCDHCGASLIGDVAIGTRSLPKSGGTGSLPKSPTTPIPNAGTATFHQMMILRLVMDSGLSVTIEPKQEMILGRRDPATGAQPDIDLTPYAGYRMGVSRRHAAIRRSSDTHLDLWDLGSSNGTYLNGNKLVSYRPNRLHDGDEIRLGQMVMRIFFEIPEGFRAPSPRPVPQGATEDGMNSPTPSVSSTPSRPPSDSTIAKQPSPWSGNNSSGTGGLNAPPARPTSGTGSLGGANGNSNPSSPRTNELPRPPWERDKQ